MRTTSPLLASQVKRACLSHAFPGSAFFSATVAVVLVMTVCDRVSHAQVCGASQDLGSLGGGVFAGSVSDDGQTVVGSAQIGTGLYRAFTWTAASGMVSLGALNSGSSSASDVSADGRVVVGWAAIAPSVDRAVKWVDGSGPDNFLIMLPNAESSYATGVSADGSVVVGYYRMAGGTNVAYRWTESGGLQLLGTLGGANTFAYAVSSDGNVVVGDSENAAGTRRAFRWTAASGIQDIGGPSLGRSFALDVSSDGAVVVGTANDDVVPSAFRWTQATGMVTLGPLPNGSLSEGHAVSADGSVIVGMSEVPGGQQQAVRWSFPFGVAQSIGDGNAWGVSADGNVVVANGGGTGFPAFRWVLTAFSPVITLQPENVAVCVTAQRSTTVGSSGSQPIEYQWQIEAPASPSGWANLSDGLTTEGMTFENTSTPSLSVRRVTSVNAVSRYQVRCLVSNACTMAISQSAIITYCPPDFDCSGSVAFQDIFAFLNAWFAGSMDADFLTDGTLGTVDIFVFLNAWFAGC